MEKKLPIFCSFDGVIRFALRYPTCNMRDIDVRMVLRERNLSRYLEDDTTLVVEEMGIFQGESRIDIAVINGSLLGYEIKSNSDNLKRLESQLTHYEQVFDFLTFVVGNRHSTPIVSMLPEWCGVIEVTDKKGDGQLTLKYIRKPKRNKNINALALAQLLWKDELLSLLNNKGITKGLSSKNKEFLWDAVAMAYSLKELSLTVREVLKSRPMWRVEK